MSEPKTKYAKLAVQAIKEYLYEGSTDELEIQIIPSESDSYRMQKQAACFVTLHKLDGSLRGCMGTLSPVRDNLYQEIIRNAIAAATRDYRFEKLKKKELNNIEISVSVLSEAVKVESIEELDPQKYGVIVTDGGAQRGVLLPAIETIDTVERQLEIVRKKADLEHIPFEKLEIFKFETEVFY